MELFGEFNDIQIEEIIEAAKLHRQFESTRKVVYLSSEEEGVIAVGTRPEYHPALPCFDLEFIVRWNGRKYVVDSTYAEFS